MKPTYPKAPFAAFSKRIEPMKNYSINIAKAYTQADWRTNGTTKPAAHTRGTDL